MGVVEVYIWVYLATSIRSCAADGLLAGSCCIRGWHDLLDLVSCVFLTSFEAKKK